MRTQHVGCDIQKKTAMILVDAVAASCAAGSKKRSVFSGQAHLIRCFSRRLCSVLHDPAGLLAFCLQP